MRHISSEQVRKDLGRRVSELRRAKTLTQAQLAELMGVSTNYLARVEGGRENLTIDSLSKLADVLGVPVLHLFLPPADTTVRVGRPRAVADSGALPRKTRARRTSRSKE